MDLERELLSLKSRILCFTPVDITNNLTSFLLIHVVSLIWKKHFCCDPPLCQKIFFFFCNRLIPQHEWKAHRLHNHHQLHVVFCLLWIMAEGGRRCSSSRSADKLSLLEASIPTVPSFLQSHRQHGSGAAHQASSQQSFSNSLPPGRQHIQTLMVSQCCLLEAVSFHLYSSFFHLHHSFFQVSLPGAFSTSLI